MSGIVRTLSSLGLCLVGALVLSGCRSTPSTSAEVATPIEGPAPSGQPGSAPTFEITVREGTSMALALSPDKRTIVIDLQGGLWSLPVAGGAARRITDEYGDARQPSFSPDGTSIAFQSYRDGTWRIWTMNADGSGAKAVTSGPFDDREPHWSPDGAKIVFSSDRAGNYDIWELTLASGAVRPLTTNPANDFYPTWSPDGREVAFVSARTPDPGIYAVNASGSERLVSAAPGNLGAPSWTPDGTRVLYSAIAAGVGRLVLGGDELSSDEDPHPFRAHWLSPDEFLYAANGQIRRRSLTAKTTSRVEFSATLTLRPAAGTYTRKRRDFDSTAPRRVLGLMHPVVSPDRRQIAFGALGDLWTMPIGGTPVKVTDDHFVDTDPAWSPDGTRLAFSSDRVGGMDIWIRDLRAGTDTRLTTMPDAEMGAAWSPDGSTIAFISNIAFEQGTVYVVDAKGGQPRKLLDQSFAPGYPSWSPDGRLLAVSTLRPYSSRFREGMNYLLVVPADGGEATLVTPVEHQPVGKRSGDGPVWSPDGKHLAYVSNGVVTVVPVDANGKPTGTPRAVTKELSDSVTWAGPNELLYIANDRLKIVAIGDGATRDVPIDLSYRLQNPTGVLVVHAGRLVDMRSPAVQTDVDIVIEGHRIKAVEPHRERPGVRVVDASGMTVLPGLIEAHGHLSKEHGNFFGRGHLAYGITTARSPGGHPYESLEDREAIESGRRIGPRIFLTGYLLDGWRPYYPMATTAPTEAVVEMELERVRALEFDLLKTYVRFPDLFQKRAIDLAHRIGVPVSSHEIYPAALSGVDSVEHTGATSRRGYSPKQSGLGIMYDDAIQIIAKSGMTITPTAALGGFQRASAADPTYISDPRIDALFPAWVVNGLRRPPAGGGGGPFGIDPRTFQAVVHRNNANLKRLYDAGARIVAGVDSPLVPYAVSLHSELDTYVNAGLSPYEALRTVTVNTAELLAADIGVVEAGKLADLVMVDGDPLTDIKDLRKVRRVVKNGEVFEIHDLLQRR
jgi:Tol biopolymer transport system component